MQLALHSFRFIDSRIRLEFHILLQFLFNDRDVLKWNVRDFLFKIFELLYES